MRGALGVTGEQHRGAEDVADDEVVGLRELGRRGEGEGRAAEECVLPVGEGGVAVVGEGDGEDVVCHLGRVGVDEREGAADELGADRSGGGLGVLVRSCSARPP